MTPRLLLVAGCAAIAACGGGTASRDGGAGGHGAGGAAGAGGTGGTGGTGGGDPVCATAVPMQPCTAPGTFCGGDGCTNVCQFCNIVQCMNGVWQSMEVAPAPCYACGADLQCQTSGEYCESTTGGMPVVPTSFRCVKLPAACQSSPTCACLEAQGVGGSASCNQRGTGELFVTLAAP